MAYLEGNVGKLCGACSGLTFAMIRDGYEHPRLYKDIVLSGKSCPLCKLIVCSMGKLQTETNCYKLEKEYESVMDDLMQLPIMLRYEEPGAGYKGVVDIMGMPDVVMVNWSRSEYLHESLGDSKVRKGNFGRGETILVTTPQDSHYREWAPLQPIEMANSPRNYGMLRDWLSNCERNHLACRFPLASSTERDSRYGTLPTRVIDVGGSNEPGQYPKLLETKGLSAKYLCLSHRWPKIPKLRTLSSNIAEFLHRLPMDQMPPTFRDAIEVTRQLGFRYLWIDSLCIVQDDTNDWLVESGRMGGIFEESACTLCAVGALDDDGNDQGLFLPPDRDPLSITLALPYERIALVELSRRVFNKRQPIVWKLRWLAPPAAEDSKNTIILHPRASSLWFTMRKTDWYRRGWVMQERVLSRRMIYYANEKLYWNCIKASGEEENTDYTEYGRPSQLPTRDESSPVRISGYWQTVVEDYVSCGLTYAKDRLIALSGLSTRLEMRFGCVVHAGVLHEQCTGSRAGEGLLWYSGSPLRGYDDFHTPSWSWSCLDGKVSYYMAEPDSIKARHSSLVRDLSFNTWNGCRLRSLTGLCKGMCVSGTVSFIGQVGRFYRSKNLRERWHSGYSPDGERNSLVLKRLIGSALATYVDPIPRLSPDGNRISDTPRHLPVPDHTELLVDTSCNNRIVGLIIPDHPVDGDIRHGGIPIPCAAIQRWVMPRVAITPQCEPGFCQEETVDIMGLEEVEGSPGTYRRIGRGRVIQCFGCESFASRSEEQLVTII